MKVRFSFIGFADMAQVELSEEFLALRLVPDVRYACLLHGTVDVFLRVGNPNRERIRWGTTFFLQGGDGTWTSGKHRCRRGWFFRRLGRFARISYEYRQFFLNRSDPLVRPPPLRGHGIRGHPGLFAFHRFSPDPMFPTQQTPSARAMRRWCDQTGGGGRSLPFVP